MLVDALIKTKEDKAKEGRPASGPGSRPNTKVATGRSQKVGCQYRFSVTPAAEDPSVSRIVHFESRHMNPSGLPQGLPENPATHLRRKRLPAPWCSSPTLSPSRGRTYCKRFRWGQQPAGRRRTRRQRQRRPRLRTRIAGRLPGRAAKDGAREVSLSYAAAARGEGRPQPPAAAPWGLVATSSTAGKRSGPPSRCPPTGSGGCQPPLRPGHPRGRGTAFQPRSIHAFLCCSAVRCLSERSSAAPPMTLTEIHSHAL